jgi:hypothetical protein
VIQVGDGAGEPPSGEAGQPSDDGKVALTLVNDSPFEICFVWIGPPESEWMGDLLEEGSVTLLSGESHTVRIVPNMWALRADDCFGNEVAYEFAYDVTTDTTWTIGG